MSKQTSSGGIGFLGLLTLIFIGLKLAEMGVVAYWSWWWVLSPFWLPITLVICIGLPFVFYEAGRKQWRGR